MATVSPLARRLLAARGVSLPDLRRRAGVPDRCFPTGVRLNRLCGPDAWFDEEWMQDLRDLAIPTHLIHRKAFEWTHCVYGLRRLGALRPSSVVLDVAAGHERLVFYLANRVRRIVAVDLYSGHFLDTEESEANPDFLTDPDKYAPLPYRRDALVAFPASGLALPFRSERFDAVISLGSIEHFGGHDAAAAAMREIARVLRPGGIACIATEIVLRGPSMEEMFAPDVFEEKIVDDSGLIPVERMDYTEPPEELFADPVVIGANIDRNPHIVMGFRETTWTSGVVFLRKPRDVEYLRLWLAGGTVRRLSGLSRAGRGTSTARPSDAV